MAGGWCFPIINYIIERWLFRVISADHDCGHCMWSYAESPHHRNFQPFFIVIIAIILIFIFYHRHPHYRHHRDAGLSSRVCTTVAAAHYCCVDLLIFLISSVYAFCPRFNRLPHRHPSLPPSLRDPVISAQFFLSLLPSLFALFVSFQPLCIALFLTPGQQ